LFLEIDDYIGVVGMGFGDDMLERLLDVKLVMRAMLNRIRSFPGFLLGGAYYGFCAGKDCLDGN
jgi:hypothetical protein